MDEQKELQPTETKQKSHPDHELASSTSASFSIIHIIIIHIIISSSCLSMG